MLKSQFLQWFPIMFSHEVPAGKIVATRLLDEPLVLFRDDQQKIICLQDRCPHRSTPLSLGRLVEGRLECRYHGWQFGQQGQCQRIPALTVDRDLPPRSNTLYKEAAEQHGLIWINMGNVDAPSWQQTYQSHFLKEDKACLRFNFSMDIDIPHELMIENLLDPSHLPFAHDGTLSKRSRAAPITFELNTQTTGLSGTATTLYPNGQHKEQHFNFRPPCTVYFDIHFNGKGLRQVHYCLPLTPKSMRLISIFYYRGMPWLRWIPFLSKWQHRMSQKIVAQDIAMLKGQQANLQMGASPWQQAINADKLAHSYRQWLVAEYQRHNPWFVGFV